MTNPFRPRQFLPGLANAVTPVAPITAPLAEPGNGPIAGFTNTFNLNLVNFDWITWHNYEWENWIVVDALLNAAIGFLNIQGFWRPSTDYLAGQSVFDPADATKLYLCLVPHTSSTDFEVDKPLFWDLIDAASPPVSSVFGRIGDVLALAADYAAFYPDKTATEAHIANMGNPHGTSWANLVGKPSTFPPSVHSHVEADITNLNKYTRAETDALLALRLALTGGSLSGFLTLHANPTAALHASTKGYVDTQVATRLTQVQADALYLTLLGGTMTGFITLHSAPSSAMHAANKGYVDAADLLRVPLAGGTMTGALTLSGAPTADLHAATKKYVDDLVTGTLGTHIGDTPPASPVPGKMWYKTNDPVGLYIWYVDADSSQWVDTGGGGMPPFATTAEAKAGVVTDKVMSPALVQARQGRQLISMTGLSTVTFDQMPAEADEFVLMYLGLECPAGFTMSLDFSGAPAARFYTSRSIIVHNQTPTGSGQDNATLGTIDASTLVQNLQGKCNFARTDGPGSAWIGDTESRRTATNILFGHILAVMNGEMVAFPRVSINIGTWTGGLMVCKWRV